MALAFAAEAFSGKIESPAFDSGSHTRSASSSLPFTLLSSLPMPLQA